MTNARPRKPGTGAVYMPGGHVYGSATDRQDQPSRAPLAVLGRAVTGGSGAPGDRLRAVADTTIYGFADTTIYTVADTAAAMVAVGKVDRAGAVAAVWLAAQAAGIGSARALAAIAAAFTRTGGSS
jgi:hypothetical protein